MAARLVLPFLGESINEAVLLRWLKAPGDSVRRGEQIAELETDKAVMELESPETGVLLQIVVSEGQRAQTGDLLAYVGKPGEVVSAAPSAVAMSAQLQPPPPAPALQPVPDGAAGSGRPRISPLARKMARANGIDPGLLAPARPGARITSVDVQRQLDARPAPPAPAPAAASQSTAQLPSYRVQFNEARRVMARRMSESAQTIPQFSVSMDVEMDAFLGVLQSLETGGQKTSVTALLAYLLPAALRQNPWLNARFDGDGVIVYETVNLGVAAASGQGLSVPVLHGLETLSLAEITRQLADKASRARSGQLALPDLAGATFTLSNLGMYGVKEFIPLVNPPQAAILGVGAARGVVLPWQAGGTRHVRQMTLTVSADHRVVDGVVVAEFLAHLKQAIETVQTQSLER